MMELIAIGKPTLPPNQFVPPFLASLVSAAECGADILPCLKSIVANLGFDHFSYGATTTAHPDRNGPNYTYTTMPDAWMRLYDRMGYIEVDPRLFLTCKSSVPVIWDQSNVRGLGPKIDAWLDDALEHGIGSGVSFMLHGPFSSHAAISLESHIERNDEIRLKAITRNLPDIHMFGHYFHEVFMLPALKRRSKSTSPGSPLSRRECECLALAAKGMTTKDISIKLHITSRTVQFHFGRIFSKLGAANRQEAIARGVQSGLVRAR